MRYCFDIDGTICTPTIGRAYDQAIPYTSRIDRINGLYDEGQKAKEAMEDITTEQLKKWGCKYHELLFGKPHADVFIDDKGVSDLNWFDQEGLQ